MKKKYSEPQSFKILVIARSGYGKTSIIQQYIKRLINQKLLDPHRLVIFSQTIKSEPKQIEFVKWLQKKCRKDYDYKTENTAKQIVYPFLSKLYETQEQLKENQRPYHHWFVLYDDQSDDKTLRYKQEPILEKIAYVGRHYAISQCYNIHSYKGILDSNIRLQCTNILLGDLSSDDNKVDIIREFSSGVSQDPKQSWKILFQAYTAVLGSNQRHGFLNIHIEKSIGEGRFEINLSDVFLDDLFLEYQNDGNFTQRLNQRIKEAENRETQIK